ncbi:hypothetical protein R1T16_05655 [Flavobacterium sp. DG1-102-2]|nr:hypothetical protein [Flavobacterium sp. DG1-102-2]MDV6167901.1 hypothetical protein [Flavobacterium sp. DG1-102-2]
MYRFLTKYQSNIGGITISSIIITADGVASPLEPPIAITSADVTNAII